MNWAQELIMKDRDMLRGKWMIAKTGGEARQTKGVSLSQVTWCNNRSALT